MNSNLNTPLEIYVSLIKKNSSTGLPYHSEVMVVRYNKLDKVVQDEISFILESRVPALFQSADKATIGIFSKEYATCYSATIGFIACMLSLKLNGDKSESKSRF